MENMENMAVPCPYIDRSRDTARAVSSLVIPAQPELI